MTESALDRLAESCGIASFYVDVNAVRHETSAESKRRLLAAMGRRAGTEDEAAAALESLDAERCRRRLPPVAVAHGDSAKIPIEVHFPESELGTTLRWRLEDERLETIDRGTLTASRERVCATRGIGGESWLTIAFDLAPPAAIGYYGLVLDTASGASAVCRVIVAPERCFRPPALEGDERHFGLTVQLYGLRSQRNWGIGDFTDLLRLVEFAAARGAAFIGLNPLHAIAGGSGPGRSPSPYSPSSRRFLNALYIDVEAVPDLGDSGAARALLADDAFRARLRALRAAELVDYEAVHALKSEALELAFSEFCERQLGRRTERGLAFERFLSMEPGLRQFVAFEAREEALHEQREQHEQRELYFAYLQWIARNQLETASRRAQQLGMAIGLYTDLALGARGDGADVAIEPDLYLDGASIGAPPDDFNPAGQNWGLPPLDPERLRASAYRQFIETLSANMRLGGALRIDHVAALMRCFAIPTGAPPGAGAYLNYRFEELLAIVALESARNSCLVVGEDLGTVPREVSDALMRVGALGTRVVYFEKDADGRFVDPADYDQEALTVASTHDLPTLGGFWQGRDIDWRTDLELFPASEQRERHVVMRAGDRAKLLMLLEKHKLAPPDSLPLESGLPELTIELRAALHAFLARTRSRLVGIQAEDLLGEIEQANLPGTTTEHPNWRRRLALNLESWSEDEGVSAIIEAVSAERRARGTGSERKRAGAARATIPRASYRVQLHAGFRFDELTSLVPYLDSLGISHCYCSPYLKARPGSLHGYDVIDHTSLNEEIGDRESFERLSTALRSRGMGQILDMVPNHVGIMGRNNSWWLDVLENGPASAFADFFDIDWQPLARGMRNKVLVPVLGDHYGNVLDSGELVLEFDAAHGRFAVGYHEHCFPIDPQRYPLILERDLELLRKRLDTTNPDLLALESLITAFANLPDRDDIDEKSRRDRLRDQRLHQASLERLVSTSSDIAHYIDECLRAYNGGDSYPSDTLRLHGLLEEQAYRLAFWRLASQEINYRRFFDINDLASLRMESPEVFDATHSLVLELVREGKVDGLRIDHPDGLYEPGAYFARLQNSAAGMEPDEPLGEDLPLYVVAEKILGADEKLRHDWPIHGTTGYEFANLVTRLMTHPDGLADLDTFYRRWTSRGADYAIVLRESKSMIMQSALASELNVLANELGRIAENDPHTRDFGLAGLKNALLEVIASFPVYRTYAVDEDIDEIDADIIERAIADASDVSETADGSVFGFLRDVLLNRLAAGEVPAVRARICRFRMRLQQYTSPVAAKGMEDTAFYRYARLISLNEVGGTPEEPTASIGEFHAANHERALAWRHSMLASSTHDSKRSEDVRARIGVISEVPSLWMRHVERWRQLNARLKTRGKGEAALPGPDMEYFIYQTLVGAWPLTEPLAVAGPELPDRMTAYAIKAAREAKRGTSWTNPNPTYEASLERFVTDLLDPETSPEFIEDFVSLLRRVARPGLFASLSALVLKLCCPGVPDIYQGNELWRFDLVDPDNRRPVDFDRRRELLAELTAPAAIADPELVDTLMTTVEDGRIKLLITARLLALRRRHPALFADGSYEPLEVSGETGRHVIAFARSHGPTRLVVAVGRWFTALSSDEGRSFDSNRLAGTRIERPGGEAAAKWSDALRPAQPPDAMGNGRHFDAGHLLRALPVAVLLSDGHPDAPIATHTPP